MIIPVDSNEVFSHNLERTNMLIQAMEKIKGYNYIYQQNPTYTPEFRSIVEKSQSDELEKFEKSCSEHAIISLCTLFETYYKSILQELLFKNPQHFLSKETKYLADITELINATEVYDYHVIVEKLKLSKRFYVYKFFEEYSIPFLASNEHDIVEYLFLLRNVFVHNAGNFSDKVKERMQTMNVPYKDDYLTTQSKRYRTLIKKLIIKIDKTIRVNFLTSGVS